MTVAGDMKMFTSTLQNPNDSLDRDLEMKLKVKVKFKVLLNQNTVEPGYSKVEGTDIS